MERKKIKSALLSVFHKDGLDDIIKILAENNVKIFSTGGTQSFIEEKGIEVTPVEDVTSYPSIFGGRVKTLHPGIFGGILYRRDNESDLSEKAQFDIPEIDLVIVDLYPFEETVASGASEGDIIEKIDIGGISLIRAAAKNFKDVTIVASKNEYKDLFDILSENNCSTTIDDRKILAAKAFRVSSHYDSAIFGYFQESTNVEGLKMSHNSGFELRYGENPHQKGYFYGNLEEKLTKIGGKELSYNNIVDVDATLSLLAEFQDDLAFVIVKHTNACGVATGNTVTEAYDKALAADPVSAFGGILACNGKIDITCAEKINELFYEVLIAPDYDDDALQLLTSKSKRIIMKQNGPIKKVQEVKTALNGVLLQDSDNVSDSEDILTTVTKVAPSKDQIKSLIFASKIAKHTKSNTIVLAKDGQLLASGVGQTSRVDSLKQAIEKAANFGFTLTGASMASDAFFPFPDCVEIAQKAGITSVIQPGGSIKDKDSIEFCDENYMTMVFTGIRHFKH